MARALGIPAERLEIEAGAIGGDFGGKSYSTFDTQLGSGYGP